MVPIGYNRITENGRKIIVTDPERAHYVRQVFELYSKGTYTYSSLAEELAQKGFTTKKNVPVNHKVIENILAITLFFTQVNFIGRIQQTL